MFLKNNQMRINNSSPLQSFGSALKTGVRVNQLYEEYKQLKENKQLVNEIQLLEQVNFPTGNIKEKLHAFKLWQKYETDDEVLILNNKAKYKTASEIIIEKIKNLFAAKNENFDKVV